MSLIALILAIVALLVGAWSVNDQRNQLMWVRDRCRGNRPRPWQLRYKRRAE